MSMCSTTVVRRSWKLECCMSWAVDEFSGKAESAEASDEAGAEGSSENAVDEASGKADANEAAADLKVKVAHAESTKQKVDNPAREARIDFSKKMKHRKGDRTAERKAGRKVDHKGGQKV